MKLQLIRNSAIWLEYVGTSFLIDPMLGEQGAYPPIINTENDLRNPLVGLPGEVGQWLKPDAVIVTHLHNDHWDEAAVSLMDKEIPVICQPEDKERIAAQGFLKVIPAGMEVSFGQTLLIRTGGRHGTGEIGDMMGPVSGFVLKAPGEPVLYIAGDTIWCEEVKEALELYHPGAVVVNAGGARFVSGDPITMTGRDVAEVCRQAPEAKVIAVHMEAINHCLLTREELGKEMKANGFGDRVLIPADGEAISLSE
ncbi:MBL fold metallo-hydrolase [Paenibacillus sp. HN-1]|uniref:MBL fold metallo-hydrolase n=1 Tax=Paenibacillus TaxID=44249 RepID=UPI001CA916B5|nr:MULTISPECIES: MBL fold metallo-hydrolase [Paenibacillus]MBY9081077.1 MBL fold metallo-hydrolase [Paenibacillus sp. CGMCC 1.18879]MBY9087114.1 MBL fold metallo-hydrolase [Paenibacillus sinensis]